MKLNSTSFNKYKIQKSYKDGGRSGQQGQQQQKQKQDRTWLRHSNY